MAQLLRDFVKIENDFTIIPNEISRNKKMKSSTKNILIAMLSLPPTWDFSIAGITTCVREGYDTVQKALVELEQMGYITRNREHREDGTFGAMIYTIHQFPVSEEKNTYKNNHKNQDGKTPIQEKTNIGKNQDRENSVQLSTDNKLNKDSESNTDSQYNTDNSFSNEKDNSKETLELHNSPVSEKQESDSRISMSLGVKQKQSKEKPLRDMPTRAKEIADSLVDDTELSEGVQQCITYILEKYKQKNRKEHLPLRNETLQNVVEVILSSLIVPHDEDLENRYQCVFYPLVSEASDWEDRKEVIDKYFDTDFREKCDYSLVHFTQRDIITHVMQKCRIGEDTYWFYSESVD